MMNPLKTAGLIPSAPAESTLPADHRCSNLEKLSREIKDKIFSNLLPTDLNNTRLVSRDMQFSALRAWHLEIPRAQRTALTAIDWHPSATVWRQAWLSQCKHLETLDRWGVRASQACNFLPDKLNPFDVESKCSQWLASETVLGNTEATEVLEELFSAICQSYSDRPHLQHRWQHQWPWCPRDFSRKINWNGRNLHSLPPFVSEMKMLQRLYLHRNQLTAIDIKDLPALQELDLRANQLTAVDIKDLPALQELHLHRNQRHLVSPEYIHAVM